MTFRRMRALGGPWGPRRDVAPSARAVEGKDSVMASNANVDRRRTRAERRAAEEAAAKARAEQAAREKRQQTVIGAAVVAVLVVLALIISVVVWRAMFPSDDASKQADMSVKEAYDALQAVETKPSTADDKGGIVMSKEGVGETVDGVPTVAVYMDFMCSGCGSFERSTGETLKTMVEAGQINLELHPMSFGDRWSEDEYSTRAANMLLALTEQDKNASHILGFVANMFAEDFQPAENSGVTTSDKQMIRQATDAGVDAATAKAAVTDRYTAWLDAIDVYTPKRSELANVTGNYKGSMTTPTITINGNFWDTNQLSLADMSSKEGLLTSLGLEESQVGVEGELPSIGADGKPISVTTGE